MRNTIALILNLTILVCEAYPLLRLRRKGDILKYYTYLQNAIALAASLILVVCFLSGDRIPEFVRGLRYIAACGLVTTTFIFVVFLGAGTKISMTGEDFLPGCSTGAANRNLHYLCPALSLVSFLVFERDLPLSSGIWTALAPVPSCLYWIVYLILSAAKLWEPPYDFSSGSRKHPVLEVASAGLIPLSFVAISAVLWKLK